MRNYQDEQNKNYENTKQMFEACRNDVGDSKKARRTMPIVDDEICFADIPENGVCITSQFENGLCGEIIWCLAVTFLVHLKPDSMICQTDTAVQHINIFSTSAPDNLSAKPIFKL